MARKHEAAVSGLLHKGYPDLHLLLDKKSMSVLPRDVSKASGLRAALNKLAIPSSDVLGLGDAENDADLFEASGYRVAVADALPQIKALAQHVTRGSGEAALNELDELLQTLN